MNSIPKKEISIRFSVPVISIDKHLGVLFFYLFVASLGLVWAMLGSTWYARILPFFDSLSYQTRTEMVLRAFQTDGWWGSFNLIAPNSFLYIPFFTTLAPVTPVTRTALYLYLLPVHLTALCVLFDFLRRKTDSLLLALLGPFLYISTVPFGITQFGVLDQRMDLATASFALLLWVAGLDWAEDYSSPKRTIFLGVAAALAFLHRPMLAVQGALVVLMIILYAAWRARQNSDLKNLLSRLAWVVLAAGLISLPWLATNLKAFYAYYITNSPITGTASFSTMLPSYVKYVSSWVGVKVGLLLILLLTGAFLSGRMSWKYLFLSAGTIVFPVVPLMLSGSDSKIVAQMCLTGVGLIPLAFSSNRRNDFWFGVMTGLAVLTAVSLSIFNLAAMAREVNQSSTADRLKVESLITRLIEKYPSDDPVYLSGFIFTEVDGPDAISSIARLELGYPLYSGAVRSHPFQFGLDAKGVDFTEEELEQAAACGLQKAYGVGGFLMLVAPEALEDQNVKAWSARGQGHIFSNSIALRMTRLAIESDRLEDTGVSGLLTTIPVRFYQIKPGASVDVKNCP